MTRAELILDLKRLAGGGTAAALAAWLGKYGPTWWQAHQARKNTVDLATQLAGMDDTRQIQGVLRREFVSVEQVAGLVDRVTTDRLEWFSREFKRLTDRISELDGEVAVLRTENRDLRDEVARLRNTAAQPAA